MEAIECKYVITPKDILLKEQESVQLGVKKINPDGTLEAVRNLKFFEYSGAGFIDEYGQLTALRAGEHQFSVLFENEVQDEIQIDGKYTVLPANGPSLSKMADGVLEKTAKEESSERNPYDSKIQKATIKRVTIDELRAKTEEKKVSKGLMAHTRAITRTIGANKDLVWLGFILIFAVVFGCSVVLLMYGFSIEKIGAFLTMLGGLVISFFGKIYSPPGEVSQEIEEKMLGTNDNERLAALMKKKESLDFRIRGLTTKIRASDTGEKQQSKTFYKMTMDER
ncbi:MAG: hypothetical protein HUU50_02650 [Candidatus Brocadiae bacterium]|nr:hypothetical protein [Candidatus Brocadiia bacterium]